MDLPTGWPVVKDQNIGGERVDLVASGPQYQGFTTNINVVSGTEEGVSGDIDYLWDQVNQTIADLEGSGHTVVLENALTFVDIDGRPAVLFTLDWQSDLAIKQRMGIIVDEALEKMYVITCTVTSPVTTSTALTSKRSSRASRSWKGRPRTSRARTVPGSISSPGSGLWWPSRWD